MALRAGLKLAALRGSVVGVALAFATVLALLRVPAWEPPIIEDLRNASFDTLQRLKPRGFPEDPVAIVVDIDDASLAAHGQWPWPRNLVADLVRRIAEAKAVALGVDVIFAEPDRHSPEAVVENFVELDDATRSALLALTPNDERLGNAFRRLPTVLGIAERANAEVPQARTLFTFEKDFRPLLPQFATALQSMPRVGQGSRSHGLLNTLPERDGVVRRMPMAVAFGGTVVPTLALETIRLAIGARTIAVDATDKAIQSFTVGPRTIPTLPDGRVWLHFTPHDPSRFVSATDLLNGEPNEVAKLSGRVALLGSTAINLKDFVTTPVQANMPGVEVHAMVIEAIFLGAFLSRPDFVPWLEIAYLFVAALVLGILIPRLKAVWTPLPLIGLLGAPFLVSWVAFTTKTWLVAATYPTVGTAIIFAAVLAMTRAAVDRARRELEVQLQHQREAAAKVEGELSAARTIQMGMLPKPSKEIMSHDDFEIFATLEPARSVSGDLYDYELIDDEHLFFMIGDVSGKGVPASLFMAITKALYKSNVLRGHVNLSQVMIAANEEISRENAANLFVTVIAGILHLDTGEIELCNAGHDAPLKVHPGEEVVSIDAAGGPPLCAMEDYPYETAKVLLLPGDVVVFLTDGITEAMNKDLKPYTMARAQAALKRAGEAGGPVGAVVDELLKDVRTFVAGAEQSDDITVLAVRYNGRNPF